MNTSTGTARNSSMITPTGMRTQAWSERRPMASTKPRIRLSTAARAKAPRVLPSAPKMPIHTFVNVKMYHFCGSN